MQTIPLWIKYYILISLLFNYNFFTYPCGMQKYTIILVKQLTSFCQRYPLSISFAHSKSKRAITLTSVREKHNYLPHYNYQKSRYILLQNPLLFSHILYSYTINGQTPPVGNRLFFQTTQETVTILTEPFLQCHCNTKIFTLQQVELFFFEFFILCTFC